MQVSLTVSFFQLMIMPGNQIARIWRKERDQQFRTELLLTSLSAGERFYGRFNAGLLYGWGSHIVILAVAVGLLFWGWGAKCGIALLLVSIFIGMIWTSIGASGGSARDLGA